MDTADIYPRPTGGHAHPELTVDLDPEVARVKRHVRAQRLNTVQIPRLRLVGLVCIIGLVFLHNELLPGTGTRLDAIRFTFTSMAYAAGSWLVLRRFYEPDRWFDLGVVFMITDLALFGGAILASGAERSLLFFLPIVRVADQNWTGVRRVMAFAVLSTTTCAAVGLLAYHAGRPVDVGNELEN